MTVDSHLNRAISGLRADRDRLQGEIDVLVCSPTEEERLRSEKRGVQRSISIVLEAFGFPDDDTLDEINEDDPFLNGRG